MLLAAPKSQFVALDVRPIWWIGLLAVLVVLLLVFGLLFAAADAVFAQALSALVQVERRYEPDPSQSIAARELLERYERLRAAKVQRSDLGSGERSIDELRSDARTGLAAPREKSVDC